MAKFGVANFLNVFTSFNSALRECCGEQLPFLFTSVLSCDCNGPVQLLLQYHLSLASKRWTTFKANGVCRRSSELGLAGS